MEKYQPKSVEQTKKTSVLFKGFLLLGVWFFSVGSAMGVVYSTYSARKATQELESLRREAIGLRVMSGQYQLEKSSWAEYSRVEQLAREKLSMNIPEAEETKLIYR